MYQQYALALTQKYEPDKAGALMESITGRAGGGKRAKRAAKLKGKGERQDGAGAQQCLQCGTARRRTMTRVCYYRNEYRLRAEGHAGSR